MAADEDVSGFVAEGAGLAVGFGGFGLWHCVLAKLLLMVWPKIGFCLISIGLS